MDVRDLTELRRKLEFVPEPASDVRLVFWSRGGLDTVLAASGEVTGYAPADMVGGP